MLSRVVKGHRASPWLQLVSRRISNAAQARSICPGLRGGWGTLFTKTFWTGEEGGEGGKKEAQRQLKIARVGCTALHMVYLSWGLVQVTWGLGCGLRQAGKQLTVSQFRRRRLRRNDAAVQTAELLCTRLTPNQANCVFPVVGRETQRPPLW